MCVCLCVCVPGPQTVDLMPVCSSAGTLLTAPSMCCMNTSQSRSNRLKANLSDTCKDTSQQWAHHDTHTHLEISTSPLHPVPPSHLGAIRAKTVGLWQIVAEHNYLHNPGNHRLHCTEMWELFIISTFVRSSRPLLSCVKCWICSFTKLQMWVCFKEPRYGSMGEPKGM